MIKTGTVNTIKMDSTVFTKKFFFPGDTGISHSKAAEKFIGDEPRTDWHDETLWFVRAKRDMAVHKVPEWEQLRELASQIKDHTLSNLDDYLLEFEKNAKSNGVKVHWAADAAEHNEIILRIMQENDVERVVKSKSMLTEECHLNPFLIDNGISVVDTDLGERIVQFRNEPPSHIVLPAIHLKKHCGIVNLLKRRIELFRKQHQALIWRNVLACAHLP